MTNKTVLALVVSSSGTFQNGLLALMTTIPSISAVLVAEDINSALRLVENHQPALIILDMATLKVQDVIKQIKEQYPRVHLIVLAEDVAQQKAVESYGADSVLLKGFPAQKLIAIVEDIVEHREDAPQAQENWEGAAKSD